MDELDHRIRQHVAKAEQALRDVRGELAERREAPVRERNELVVQHRNELARISYSLRTQGGGAGGHREGVWSACWDSSENGGPGGDLVPRQQEPVRAEG